VKAIYLDVGFFAAIGWDERGPIPVILECGWPLARHKNNTQIHTEPGYRNSYIGVKENVR
jgi:hypothetical protein